MRRFLHFEVEQLEKQASVFPEDIPEILDELSNHRNSRAARALLFRLQAKIEKSPGASGLVSMPEQKTRKRVRPDDWETLFDYKATAEQERAVDAFLSRKSMKVSAFAGAGKTSTLQFLAATAPTERGLYLAFNKSIAADAGKAFGRRVDCRTTHSAALRSVRSAHSYSAEKLFNSLGPKQLVHEWSISPLKLEWMTFRRDMLAFLFIDTVRKYCQSGHPQIGKQHVSFRGKSIGLSLNEKEEVYSVVLRGAQQLWQQMIDENSSIPLGHDGYLKLWSLMAPKLPYDYILLDEAQDTNGAVLSLLQKQDAQLVFVGDRHQQIYEWRGAVNAMEKIDAASEVFLTKSFRFGPRLAETANKILRALGESHPIVGFEQIQTKIHDFGFARTILARTNAKVFKETLDALSDGLKPFVVGGTQSLIMLLRDVEALMDEMPGSQPEFFGFSNWNEVVAFSEQPEGADLKPFVDLVDKVGVKALWKAVLSCSENEGDADVVISTAHKSKGREWDSVRIAEDFDLNLPKKEIDAAAEARLFYVAITRARKDLILPTSLLDVILKRFEVGEPSEDQSQTVDEAKARPQPLSIDNGPLELQPKHPLPPSNLSEKKNVKKQRPRWFRLFD